MTLSLFPDLHPYRRILIRPLVTRSARMADAIITASQSARNDIVRLGKVPEEKVHLVYNAAAPCFRPLPPEDCERTFRRYHLPEKFVLFIGTIEPRKNLVRLLDAFSQLKRRINCPHQLVLAGQPGWNYQEVFRRMSESDLERDVRLLGYVPFEDLPPLYNLCDLFVYPSLYEGFGLPVIEAMACGRPAVASTTSAISEIFDGSFEEVDPKSVESICSGLERLIADPERKSEVAQRGLERSVEFSWTRAAQKTQAIYESVARP